VQVWGIEGYAALTTFWDASDTRFFYAALPLCA
jgi:hypothetical protein